MVFLLFTLHTFDCNGPIATPSGPSSPVCATYDTEYVFEGSFDLKLAIATEMLETVDWNEESQAKARQYLYNLLMQDPELAESRSEFMEFIELYENCLHGEYEVNNELRNIEQYNELFEIMLNETNNLIQNYTDSINYIFDNDLEGEYSETLEWLYYQVNFLEQTKGNLISQRQAFVSGELGEIIHDYIVNPELPSINTQYINSVYAAFLDSGDNEEIIVNEYTGLLAVAHQCPAAGGQSVYQARAMLAMINDSIEYNDPIVCLQSGIYREAASEIINPKFNIIPNPAQNSIEFIIDDFLSEICTLEIVNSLGQSMLNKEIDCKKKSHHIDISILKDGIYIVKIFMDNEIVDTQKLVKIK